MVAAAVAVGADAVHPGYGFLSERAAFARAVEKAGLTLVGPTADVMDRMGRKDAAREIAVEAGVPVIPSYDGTADPATFDFPVLVKAAAGGGGKGMRIVRSAGEYAAAVASAQREASSAFGDDTILVEKYVEHGRHIEVQVLADHHGNVVHLFERDCSTQRRHQKVLEEAPAPTISEAVRRTVTEASVALAAHVGYRNAGTVEFLLEVRRRAGTPPCRRSRSRRDWPGRPLPSSPCGVRRRMVGAGASSRTFWCRRWAEQSRSKRCSTVPWLSARTCTSTWRPCSTYFSISIVSSPNALLASRWAEATAAAYSSALRTMRMPLPPPPAAAFTSTG